MAAIIFEIRFPINLENDFMKLYVIESYLSEIATEKLAVDDIEVVTKLTVDTPDFNVLEHVAKCIFMQNSYNRFMKEKNIKNCCLRSFHRFSIYYSEHPDLPNQRDNIQQVTDTCGRITFDILECLRIVENEPFKQFFRSRFSEIFNLRMTTDPNLYRLDII
ncbi:hypothetical protein RF11_00499 [Thelohanellus kitauei]|uniref:Uncharacterized protein n=1 Tax=Thelohanellus kitauei TaxID=669202 RepID=A0A0C2JH55_THEKT|nr:hypothetical protein RF11_00499 [Thelohanellus kitauei]